MYKDIGGYVIHRSKGDTWCSISDAEMLEDTLRKRLNELVHPPYSITVSVNCHENTYVRVCLRMHGNSWTDKEIFTGSRTLGLGKIVAAVKKALKEQGL